MYSPYTVYELGAKSQATLFSRTTASAVGITGDGSTSNPYNPVFGGTGENAVAANANTIEELDIFEALYDGYAYYKKLVPAGDSQGVAVYYQPNVVDTPDGDVHSYYVSAQHAIYIANQTPDHTLLYWQLVLHEYGHYIADINGFFANVPNQHGASSRH